MRAICTVPLHKTPRQRELKDLGKSARLSSANPLFAGAVEDGGRD